MRPKSRFGGLERGRAGAASMRGAGQLFSGKRPMSTVRLDDLKQYSDVIRSTKGAALIVRFVEPGDAGTLQGYFRSLSVRSRYSRFFSAMSELPHNVLDQFMHVGERDQFSVVVTTKVDGFETIIGEARYAFYSETRSVEFGLSIDDRWQRQGIGWALLRNLECRAAAFGAERLLGDTLRSNEAMIGLARKSGYTLSANPDDWRLARFVKQIGTGPKEIAWASWRLAATGIAGGVATNAEFPSNTADDGRHMFLCLF
jgi:RimJ/RimL family protein N-acetyltransferase